MEPILLIRNTDLDRAVPDRPSWNFYMLQSLEDQWQGNPKRALGTSNIQPCRP